jgi:hypothetical protein
MGTNLTKAVFCAIIILATQASHADEYKTPFDSSGNIQNEKSEATQSTDETFTSSMARILEVDLSPHLPHNPSY